MFPQGAVFEILFEVPLKKGKPLFLSRSALHGHEVGLNGPQDIDGSFIDIPLGVPRTSFPGLGPPVTGGRRRFPSKGWRQFLIEPPFFPMRSFLSLRISLNVGPPQLGGGGVVFPPSSSHQGQATPPSSSEGSHLSWYISLVIPWPRDSPCSQAASTHWVTLTVDTPLNSLLSSWFWLEFFFYIFGGDFFIFFVLYSTLLHLPPLRFHCADGCWDRTQDRCN